MGEFLLWLIIMFLGFGLYIVNLDEIHTIPQVYHEKINSGNIDEAIDAAKINLKECNEYKEKPYSWTDLQVNKCLNEHKSNIIRLKEFSKSDEYQDILTNLEKVKRENNIILETYR